MIAVLRKKSGIWVIFTALLVTLFFYWKYMQSRDFEKIIANLDQLIPLETAYKRDLWIRVREELRRKFSTRPGKELFKDHKRYLKRLELFISKDLNRFNELVQDG